MSLFNYVALFTIAVFGIVFLDEDSTSVSPQEWVLFAVMIYAALSFFRQYKELVSKERRR